MCVCVCVCVCNCVCVLISVVQKMQCRRFCAPRASCSELAPYRRHASSVHVRKCCCYVITFLQGCMCIIPAAVTQLIIYLGLARTMGASFLPNAFKTYSDLASPRCYLHTALDVIFTAMLSSHSPIFTAMLSSHSPICYFHSDVIFTQPYVIFTAMLSSHSPIMSR